MYAYLTREGLVDYELLLLIKFLNYLILLYQNMIRLCEYECCDI